VAAKLADEMLPVTVYEQAMRRLFAAVCAVHLARRRLLRSGYRFGGLLPQAGVRLADKL